MPLERNTLVYPHTFISITQAIIRERMFKKIFSYLIIVRKKMLFDHILIA